MKLPTALIVLSFAEGDHPLRDAELVIRHEDFWTQDRFECGAEPRLLQDTPGDPLRP